MKGTSRQCRNKRALKETSRLRREQAGYEGNKQAMKEASRL